jgi:hypothetical protein
MFDLFKREEMQKLQDIERQKRLLIAVIPGGVPGHAFCLQLYTDYLRSYIITYT